jgi:hypothetical protein
MLLCHQLAMPVKILITLKLLSAGKPMLWLWSTALEKQELLPD